MLSAAKNQTKTKNKKQQQKKLTLQWQTQVGIVSITKSLEAVFSLGLVEELPEYIQAFPIFQENVQFSLLLNHLMFARWLPHLQVSHPRSRQKKMTK